MVTQLFEHLRGRPQTHVVTYGGLSAEIPLFNLAAIEHQLDLPPQLQSGHRVRLADWRPHIDFALMMKGNGRDWAHMTEVGLRLGLSGELFAGKADIAEPQNRGEWEAMRHRVSTDCILTAMIALAYWRANGLIKLDQSAALLTIADWCLRNRCVADAHVEPLTARVQRDRMPISFYKRRKEKSMKVQQIIDDMNNGVVRIEEYDLTTISKASGRLMQGGQGLSTHEHAAAAIVNGRLDLLNDDFRKALIEMGRTWAHATIAAIFDHWEREMALSPDHPHCPSGEQLIFTRRRGS